MASTVDSSATELRKRQSVSGGVTLAEVAKHNTASDCWIIIEGKAYDVTSWVSKHPGGQDIILAYGGMDATDVYDAFHDVHEESHEKMRSLYYVGDVTDQKLSDSIREFREIKRKLKQDQQFQSRPLFYAGLMSMMLAMWSSAVFLVLRFQGQSWAVLTAAVLLALFWLQMGWFGHDVHHNQVFPRSQKKFKSLTCRVGEMFLGFTTSWWNNKHNMHHAVPNVKGGDPDIATFPLLAWADLILEGHLPLQGRPLFLIKYQPVLYPILLCFARMAWAVKSVAYSHEKGRTEEVIAIGLHYTWLSYLLLQMSFSHALMFFVVSQGLGGLLLAAAFSVNHNGMDVLPERTQATMDFHTLQAVTSRDVTGGAWIPWYMGGLDKQIEHHLFPRLPRHNLEATRSTIRNFCNKHNIRYHSTDFWTATAETVQRLVKVSEKATHHH